MSVLGIAGIGAAIIISLYLLSDILFRVFTSLLLTAGIVTLSAWVLMLVCGAVLFIGIPIWCGITDHDVGKVFYQLFYNGKVKL